MLGLILLLQTLTIAVSGPPTSAEYLPLRVAEAEGFFLREGLSVTLRSTRAEVGAAEALAQAQVDVAATSLEAILRFGTRAVSQAPRLVYGLTAAPPVALLVGAPLNGTVRSVDQLAGLRVGVAAPGDPAYAWLVAVLARARISIAQVEMVSLGERGLVSAFERGEVHAGIVEEPSASRLVADHRAMVVADLRAPAAVTRALGVSTMNAGVFVRADRRPPDRDLAALIRALTAAEFLIATSSAEALAARLPRAVVGVPDEFARRIETSRGLYLPDGKVTPAQVRATIDIVRAHMPFSPTLRIPSPDELLSTTPVRRTGPRAK